MEFNSFHNPYIWLLFPPRGLSYYHVVGNLAGITTQVGGCGNSNYAAFLLRRT